VNASAKDPSHQGSAKTISQRLPPAEVRFRLTKLAQHFFFRKHEVMRNLAQRPGTRAWGLHPPPRVQACEPVQKGDPARLKSIESFT